MRLIILAKHLHSLRVFFRTEYGSPITSHYFREVLAHVETDLIKNCEDRYDFKWTKHVTLIPLGICILPIYKVRG